MHITVLSTYPSTNAKHGGQHRVANVISELRNAGHEVSTKGILGSDSYETTDGFLPFPGYKVLQQYIDNAFLMEDWAIGRWAVSHGPFQSLSRLIDKDTAIIFCEHPWLFSFCKKFRREMGRKDLKIVYSSHNIEAELKRQIISSHFGSAYAETCRNLILKDELEAIEVADLISTVSSSDAEWTRQYSRAPIVVAPNGVAPNRASIQDVIAANAITGHRKFALYVASGHPPNVTSFYDIIGAGIGSLGPADRMVVAGAAGQAIRNDARFDKVAGLASSFVDAGIVSDAELRGLLQSAHCIFLPMTSGGGTNLKTAEALWSGRPVVATTTAMRGFEAFQEAGGVTVCRDKGEFLSALQRQMAAPRFEIDREERNARSALIWSETLKPLIEAVHERLH